MENSVYDQFLRFVRAAVFGGGAGVFYGLLGLLRAWGNAVLTGVSDCLFWLLAGSAAFLFILAHCNGRAEGYVLIAMALGAIVTAKVTGRLLAWPVRQLEKRGRTARKRRKIRTAQKIMQKNRKNFV